MALAKMLEILEKEKKPLSVLSAEIPRYEVFKTKIVCPNEKKELVMNTVVDQVKDNADVKTIDRTDGVKLYLHTGWVLLRPSGTEPMFRIYAEAKEKTVAEHLALTYKKRVEKIIEEG
jgi:phosphomannomutase/phosphoglucomutase